MNKSFKKDFDLFYRKMLRNVIFLTFLAEIFGCIQNPTVTISDGLVQGTCTTNGDRELYSFLSIPYAKPPVNQLRFKPPERVKRWNHNVLEATTFRNVCSQFDLYGSKKVIGNEDCLYLNVYTPKIFSEDKLPVMVYFHAGAFELGSGNEYDPKALLRKNIVLIIPNYRLGALGFLSTGDEVVPGNNGLKDQNFALQWVKRNVLSFGGDPNKITVFGQSAGGSSAHYHMLSPLSKDLIAAAISQSGVATSIWSFDFENNVPKNTRSLAKLCKCLTCNTFYMIECLRNVPSDVIILSSRALPNWAPYRMTPFRPVIEPNLPGSFIWKHPFDIIKSNEAAKIPFITGITTEDGCMISPSVFTNNETMFLYNNNFEIQVPSQLDYINNPFRNYITNRIKDFYYKNKSITDTDRSRSNVTNMYTDRMFLYSQNNIIKLHLKHTNQSVYNYAFGYRGSKSHNGLFGDPSHNYGTCHADDVYYLFPQDPLDRIEKQVSELLIQMWVNFALYKNPTPKSSNHIRWKPVQSNDLEYLFINDTENTQMLSNLYRKRYQFWNSIPLFTNTCNSNNNYCHE